MISLRDPNITYPVQNVPIPDNCNGGTAEWHYTWMGTNVTLLFSSESGFKVCLHVEDDQNNGHAFANVTDVTRPDFHRAPIQFNGKPF